MTADLVHGVAASRFGGWAWREPRRGEHFRRCSYCGSIHPDDLVAELTAGARPEWTDMKYGWPHKFYVQIPNRDAQALFVVGGTSGGPDKTREQLAAEGYVPVEDLTDEQLALAKRDGWGDLSSYRGVQFGTRESHFGKFYTAHLADPTISDETLDAIAKASGLRFTFADGRISWTAEPAA